jgi:manganese oxidase
MRKAQAVITAALGLPMWIDLIVEYVASFGFGLLIFQALFMKGMMGGTYRKALRSSFMPEWLSMNMMAAGMFPVMILLMMGRDMRAMEPTEPLFWAVMSFGVIVGFATAYPVNVWMVAKNLKHGLMTARPAPADRSGAPAPIHRHHLINQPHRREPKDTVEHPDSEVRQQRCPDHPRTPNSAIKINSPA